MKLARETEMRETQMRLDTSNEESKAQIQQSDLSIVFSRA
jgi:hypothetical protein